MTCFSRALKRSPKSFFCQKGLFFLCSVVVLAFGLGSQARAASDMQTAIEAPASFTNPAARASAFGDAQTLGIRAARFMLFWYRVAPASGSSKKPNFDATNPDEGYNWSEVDPVISRMKEHGMSVLLTVTGPAPKWATAAKRDEITRPDSAEYKAFVTAVAKRYGSSVSVFALWNEPNLFTFLRPQLAGGVPASPKIYRSLVQAGLEGLKDAGYGDTTTIVGETAPGSLSLNAVNRIGTLRFLREFFCLSKRYQRRGNCAKLDIDGFAIHPYVTTKLPFSTSANPDDVRIGYLGRVTKALDKAARAGAVKRGLPVYLTEFGVESCPDRAVGVSFEQQAELLGMSERIAYENPRVKWFAQYLLNDAIQTGSSQTGLRTGHGKPKPSFDGFRLPLAVRKSGGRVSIWGRVRPAAGQQDVTLLVADKGQSAFRKLRDLRTNERGVFVVTDGGRSGRRWKLQWTDQTGTTYTGAAIRAYAKTLNSLDTYEHCKK